MRVLELCCAEGGATRGYQQAGMEVFAVDMEPKFFKRNPAEAFHAGDGLKVLETLLAGDPVMFTRRATGGKVNAFLHNFDLIHMSPPCQGYSRGNAGRVTSWPRLIGDFRKLALATGLPYVIENVKDAAFDMWDPMALCGCMFDLYTTDDDGETIHLQRLRMFETSWGMTAPRECDHSAHEWVAGAYGGARRDKYEAKYVRKGGYVPPNKDVVKRLLGFEESVDMTWNGLFESIPPAYAHYVATTFVDFKEE